MDFKTRFQPFDSSMKKTKRVSGRSITFVEWVQYIIRAHTTDFPEGFSVEVRSVKEVGGVHDIWNAEEGEMDTGVDDRQCVVVMRVIDNATGCFMDATGTAPISKTKANWGGALAEAESQALRRAFAKWGVGLEMYLDEDEYHSTLDVIKEATEPKPEPPSDRQIQTMQTLMWVVDEAMGLDDEMADKAAKIGTAARRYVKERGNHFATYEKLIPQVRGAMRDIGILPVNDIQFANALDILNMEPTNPAAQALIDEQEQDHE